jgi:hypothetical protein
MKIFLLLFLCGQNASLRTVSPGGFRQAGRERAREGSVAYFVWFSKLMCLVILFSKGTRVEQRLVQEVVTKQAVREFQLDKVEAGSHQRFSLKKAPRRLYTSCRGKRKTGQSVSMRLEDWEDWKIRRYLELLFAAKKKRHQRLRSLAFSSGK